MAMQTVIVLSNNHIDGALNSPDFLDELKRAIHETVRTGKHANIGVNYGRVMPYHHGYDPTLFLSYGGILTNVGSVTVERLPQSPEETTELVERIVHERTNIDKE